MDAYSSLEKTINLIENNLDNQDLNISFLSKKVFVSPYHLQRIFYTLFGKTIGSYIRERRLTEAGTDIKNGEKVAIFLHISPKSTTFASKYTQSTMEHKSCPRCGAAFICQHENPAKCQCAGVELSPATRAHLAAQYPNQCLCRKCLLEFSV